MESIYANVILWAVFLFLGYIGYGEVVVRLLNRAEFNDFGWAAKAAVGMCVSIVLGSALMVFRAATPVGLVSVAVVGFGCAIWAFFLQLQASTPTAAGKKRKGKPAAKSEENFGWLFLIVPGAFALLAFATSVYWPFQYDPNDDWVAYLAFPEKILQTGTLIEPFSQRRITSLCGQSVLLAQIMIVAEPESAHLLDRGFGAILLFGLLVEATRKTAARWQWLRALFVLAAVTVSVPRINTSSTVIGVCMMFGVLFSITKTLDSKDPEWKVWVLPALILAGASSLRFTYALTCGGALAIYYFWRTIISSPKFWIQQIMPLFKIGTGTFLFLTPLMIVSWESSRTPIYPPFAGNLATEFLFFNTGKGFLSDSFIAAQLMLIPEILTVLLCFPLVFFDSGERRKLSLSIIMIALALTFLIGINGSSAVVTWTLDFYRQAFPLCFVAFLWLICSSLEQMKTFGFFSAPSMSGVALSLFAIVQFFPALDETKNKFLALPITERGFKFNSAELKPFYEELQNQVPEGEKIFAVVDAPYLLNYSRNPISNVDNIAGASPPPGMPFHKGSDALKSYLADLGYNYILAVDFDKAVFLYNRKVMENHPRHEFKEFSKKYVVDFLDMIDSICNGSKVIRNSNTRLIMIGKKVSEI